VRDRARVVVVGRSAWTSHAPRSTRRRSRSVCPGPMARTVRRLLRRGGHDYPVGYVRWTEGRNLGAFLDLLAQRKIDVARLTTHRFGLATRHEPTRWWRARRRMLPGHPAGLRIPASGWTLPASRRWRLPNGRPRPARWGRRRRCGLVRAVDADPSPEARLPGSPEKRRRLERGDGPIGGRAGGLRPGERRRGQRAHRPGVGLIVMARATTAMPRWPRRVFGRQGRLRGEAARARRGRPRARTDAVANASDAFLMLGFNRRFAPWSDD